MNDEVWIATGSYLPSLTDTRTDHFYINAANVMVFGGFIGGETMAEQRNHVDNPTIISGNIGSGNNLDNSQTIFQVAAANILISGLIIEDGYADGGGQPHNQGAGIYATSGATDLVIEDCVFRGHYTNNRGPAIGQPNTSGSMEIINCVFENNMNTGTDGGAIYTKAITLIENSVFVGNQGGEGGAISFGVGAASGNINHVTFYNNTASGNGGHIFSGSSDLAIQNSIFWNSVSADGNAIYKASGVTTSYFSLIEGGSSLSWPGGTIGSDGGNNIDFDPMFSDNLQPDGSDMKWFTEDDGLSLTAGSNAIDAGMVTFSTHDITGHNRDGNPDMGAYEFGAGSDLLLVDDTMFVPPAYIMPDGYDQVMSFKFENQSGSTETINKLKFNILSGNGFDVSTIDIFNGAVLEATGNAATGNLIGNEFEFWLNSPIVVSAGTNVTFSVNIEIDSVPVDPDIQFELMPSNFYLTSGNVVDGDTINTGLISFSAGSGGGDLIVSDNLSFTPPTDITPGSFDVDVLNYNIFNDSGNIQYIDAININVTQGTVNDITEITMYENGGFLVTGNNFSGNYLGGNINFAFNPPIMLTAGANNSYEVELDIDGSPAMSLLDLNINPGDYDIAGGNSITGDSLNTGAINLSSPPTGLELQDNPGFVAPTDMTQGDNDIIVLEFQLLGGANIELIDHIEFNVIGDVYDITQLEIYDISNNFALVASANMTDGDGDGLLDYLDPDSMNPSDNISNGNIFFRGMPIYESLAYSSNTLELKISIDANAVSDNLEFSLDPSSVLTVGDNLVSGNYVTSGPIPILAGGSGGNVLLVSTPFVAPTNVSTSSVNIALMEFELDTTTNSVASPLLNDIEFEVISGDAINDFEFFELYDESLMSVVSSVSTLGNVIGGNLVFYNLSHGLSGGSNTVLSLRGTTSSSFVSDNIELELFPENIYLSSDGVSGSPINSGFITLGGNAMGSGNLEMYQTGFFAPTDLNPNDEAQVLEFLIENNGVTSEQLDVLEVFLPQGNAFTDLSGATELINLNTGNVLVSASPTSSNNIDINSINLVIPGSSNVLLGVNVLISSVPESGMIEFEVNSDSLGFLSGNFIQSPITVNSGVINLGGNTMAPSGNFTSLAIGRNHALYINQGELFAVGNNDFSALGNVSSTMESFPIKIGTKTDWVQVGVSSGHSVAVDESGNVFGWGTNFYERLELLSSPAGTPTQLNFGGTAHEIAVSESATFVLDDANFFHAIGRNQLGQLGIGSTSASENVFTQLSGLGEVTAYDIGVDHGLAVVSGNLYAWGSDGFGQLGTNSVNVFTATPVLVDNANVWIDVIAGGFHSFGITNTNQVYAWGKNVNGQLCDSGISDHMVDIPTAITGLPGTIAEISAGLDHTLMLFDNGNVYVGGSNDLDQGTPNSMNGLDQLFDFTGADAIEAGPYSSAAIFGSNIQMIGQSFDGSTLTTPTVIGQ